MNLGGSTGKVAWQKPGRSANLLMDNGCRCLMAGTSSSADRPFDAAAGVCRGLRVCKRGLKAPLMPFPPRGPSCMCVSAGAPAGQRGWCQPEPCPSRRRTFEPSSGRHRSPHPGQSWNA